jgi:D-glycero-alpha-D-manno-heptose 1-phosphate guanylyltransferase
VEAIILAGGRGTRLHAALPVDLPKPLAPVAGRPFLHWLLDSLARTGFNHILVSVGWHAEKIVASLGTHFAGLEIDYCHESQPLGTGGAMKAALRHARDSSVFVFNGDTYVDLDFRTMLDTHRAAGSQLTIACITVPNTSRYGRVILTGNVITSFAEKGALGEGLINAGAYVLESTLFSTEHRDSFSFEEDFLMPNLIQLRPTAFLTSGPFIDIGTPTDLTRAQDLLQHPVA